MPLVNREARLAKQDPRRRFLKYFLAWLRDQQLVNVPEKADDEILQRYLDHERDLTAQVVTQVAKKAKDPDADPRPGLTRRDKKQKELVS